VCVRALHGSPTLTLTRPPPQPHTQQQESKEGRWCGRPRCCCHCRQASPCHLFSRLWSAVLWILQSERPYRICWLMQLHHRKSFRVVWRFQWRVGSDDWWLECLLCQYQTAGPQGRGAVVAVVCNCGLICTNTIFIFCGFFLIVF
ncbi:hypothetical protein TcG_11931, partial [Trypanosoma cruzi]